MYQNNEITINDELDNAATDLENAQKKHRNLECRIIKAAMEKGVIGGDQFEVHGRVYVFEYKGTNDSGEANPRDYKLIRVDLEKVTP